MSNYKKVLTLFDLTTSSIGFIIGAGIYSTIGMVSSYSGNFTWLSFLLTGIFSCFTALDYSELSSMYKSNKGEYIYIKESFNEATAIIVGYLLIFSKLLINCALSLAMGYLLKKVFNIHELYFAIFLIILCCYLSYLDIKSSITITNVLTIIEIFGLLLIITLTLPLYKKVGIKVLFKKNSKTNIFKIFRGSLIAFFAFFGFENSVSLTEESEDYDNIHKSIIISLIFCIFMYVLVSISVVLFMNVNKTGKEHLLIDICKKYFGKSGFYFMFIISFISILNTCLMQILGGSRYIQSISRDIYLPEIFSKLDKNKNTPLNSIILNGILTIILVIIIRKFNIITSLASFMGVLIFIFINLSVIILRFKKPNIYRKFRIPFNISNVPITSIFAIIFNICVLVSFFYKNNVKI